MLGGFHANQLRTADDMITSYIDQQSEGKVYLSIFLMLLELGVSSQRLCVKLLHILRPATAVSTE